MNATPPLMRDDRPERAMSPPSADLPAPLQEVAEYFDDFSKESQGWRRKNRTYYRLIESIMTFVVPKGASVLEVGSAEGDLLAALEPSRGVGIDISEGMVESGRERHPDLEFVREAGETFVRDETFDYVVLSYLVQMADDLLAIFRNALDMSHPETRLIVHSYSQAWKPIIRLAEVLRLKPRKPIRNWVGPDDVRNLLNLAGFEVISLNRRILMPKQVPLLTRFLNGYVANIWPFSHFTLTFWIVARPFPTGERLETGVSVVCPCRNEEEMIERIVEEVPEMGTGTELVFVDDGSTDGTKAEIERQIALHPDRQITLVSQTGQGKATAVRSGFAVAKHDVLMILDADLTVRADDLPRFYDVLVTRRGELVNGSRLVYGLEPGSMRFLNILGNKVFSIIYSNLLSQPVKDTLCGTKVLTRANWHRIDAGRAYFGDFDRWGDFDLLLGAAKLNLKIVDLPVRYGARTAGESKMSRFRHGRLMFQMAAFAFSRLKAGPVRLSRRVAT